MSALPQDPHAKPVIAVRVETNQHRHALARVIAGPDAGDDEVSFGHGKKRQLRHAHQPAHVLRAAGAIDSAISVRRQPCRQKYTTAMQSSPR
jgi:hypothetical protein